MSEAPDVNTISGTVVLDTIQRREGETSFAFAARVVRKTLRSFWPRPGRERLSKRVASAIAANDTASEVLVKIIQFVIFALFGLIYLAAPQPDPETRSMVPLVISAYLVFTLILLFLAAVRPVPTILIYVSIAVDMALLSYLIWSFHIQYGQPASFSLKSVEVMNYFVLIALRTLRFEIRYVAAAGFLAAFCWAVLLILAIEETPGKPMTTRSYVDYLTGNEILVGAEISKIISILMVTGILALAARRAHSFLVSSVSEASAAEDLSRFVANDVVDQIVDAENALQAGDGVRRDAAILNVDIRGFTRMAARMEPGDAMTLLAEYQHGIVPLAHRHHGTIDKFMGDGIMITFGATSEDPQYAANALRCVDDILAHLDEDPTLKDKQLKVNLAVTAGPVIFGAVGDGDRLEVTVIGSAVNLSAKLEKQNKALSTRALCEGSLYDLAREQGYRPTAGRAKPERRTTSFDDAHDELEIVVLG